MSLQGKKVAILAGPDYEDLELHYPHLKLIKYNGGPREGLALQVPAKQWDD